MKFIYFSTFLFLSIVVFCQNQKFDKTESLLYLSYSEYDEGLTSDYDIIIDDFSTFYPLINIYYFDGMYSFNQQERILFEIYGDNRIISEFPYKYSNIQIDSIHNDTMVFCSINNKSFNICRGQAIIDTIVYEKKVNGKLKKFRTIVSLDFADYLKKERIFDNSNRKEKEIEFRIRAPLFAEVMPQFEYNGLTLDAYLNTYGLCISNSKSMNNSWVRFVVNEFGSITVVVFLRGINYTADKRILKAFYEMPRWIPAVNGNEKVPVEMILELKDLIDDH